MHTVRIVFRDLKIENILLQPASDTVLLTDFGLAKQIPEEKDGRTDTVCGTIEYMGLDHKTVAIAHVL